MSMYDEVMIRIKQLRMPNVKWVKRAPQAVNEMCAVMGSPLYRNQMDRRTVERINFWLYNYTDGKWKTIIEYNDDPAGAQSVDDVIVFLEKFAAELS